jgi:hypothetical protein
MTSLVNLLFDDDEAARRELTSALVGMDVPVRPAVIALVPDLLGEIGREITAFLDMPVEELLRSAWDKQQLVREALDKTRDRPGARMRVSVLQHTLTTTQRPRVEIVLDRKRYELVDLVLKVTLEIESLVVDVREGEVEAWGPGDASCSAELAVAPPGGSDEHRLARVESKPIRLESWDRGGISPMPQSGWPPPLGTHGR